MGAWVEGASVGYGDLGLASASDGGGANEGAGAADATAVDIALPGPRC